MRLGGGFRRGVRPKRNEQCSTSVIGNKEPERRGSSVLFWSYKGCAIVGVVGWVLMTREGLGVQNLGIYPRIEAIAEARWSCGRLKMAEAATRTLQPALRAARAVAGAMPPSI